MKTTETSHFWLGRFPSMKRLAAYFAEVYGEDDEDDEPTAVSEFARDQGESWYDHDFLEYGYSETCTSVEELVTGYSYHEQWRAELAERARHAGLAVSNTVVFISEDQISQPRSVDGAGYELQYLGTITYRI